MAITIVQKPYTLTPLNQKLIFTLSSTQVAQPGFRFVVSIAIAGETLPNLFYVPNAVNRGQIDIREIIRPYIKQSMTVGSPNTHVGILGYTTIDAGGDIEEVVVTFYDGYEIAGVFEVVDGPTDGVVTTHYIWNGFIQSRYGYRPDPDPFFQLGSGGLTAMKRGDIYKWDRQAYYSLEAGIAMPVYGTDFGVLNFLMDDGNFSGNPAGWKIRQVVQQASGVPVTVTETVAMPTQPSILVIGAYPANVSGDSGLTWTVPDADFIYIAWQILDAADQAVSPQYIMWNVYHDVQYNSCKYDNVRVAWANQFGGWDYFNFNLRNEIVHEIDRKRFKKVNGTYNDTAFTFPVHDRGFQEFDLMVDSVAEVTSDWISEAAYQFLRSLLLSKDVYVIGMTIDGSSSNEVLGVVIEDNSFRQRADRSGKKYNLNLRLKFSLNQFAP